MEINRVSASRGWDWVAEAFELYRKNPLIWTSLVAVYLIISVALSLIPFHLGLLVQTLLVPVFLAGFMIGCRAQALGDEVELAHLFDGFKHNSAGLIGVGGFYLMGQFLVALAFLGVIKATIGIDAFNNLEHIAANPDTEQAIQAAQGLLLAMLVGLALLLPVLMALWFSPALVVFDNLSALQAIKTSIVACIRNFVPFLVYGVITFGFAIIATIPLYLGWLVLFPVLTISIFTSYRDIFTPKDEAQPAEPSQGL